MTTENTIELTSEQKIAEEIRIMEAQLSLLKGGNPTEKSALADKLRSLNCFTNDEIDELVAKRFDTVKRGKRAPTYMKELLNLYRLPRTLNSGKYTKSGPLTAEEKQQILNFYNNKKEHRSVDCAKKLGLNNRIVEQFCLAQKRAGKFARVPGKGCWGTYSLIGGK